MSFHILIATIGNRSIFYLLESLVNQLNQEDYLTIVFDGEDIAGIYDEVKTFCQKIKSQVHIIMAEKNLGYWGHGIRNKYQYLAGDFIMHADDDDEYLPDAMSVIRKHCQNKETLYIFSLLRDNGNKIFHSSQIVKGHISTQSGVIPNALNRQGTWEYIYSGDFDFYKSIEGKAKNIKWIDHPIYQRNSKSYHAMKRKKELIKGKEKGKKR